jgi:hypothetical protein
MNGEDAAVESKKQLGNCRTPHFLGEPPPDRKALTQIPHYELPNGLCKDWAELGDGEPSPPPERSIANATKLVSSS